MKAGHAVTSPGNVVLFIADINECAVKNGGCTQVCNDVAMGSNCSCFPGYQLGANNTSCNGNKTHVVYMYIIYLFYFLTTEE